MITAIHLQNFLSHADTALEFSPGVNILVGKSDTGKTSIIRALRWVVENRPAGDEFKSYWAGKQDTSVDIDLGSQGVVSRIKGPSTNCYFDGVTQYNGIGQDVPPQIKDLLAIDDLNIQHQLDGPFLLGDSPGAVARYLNRIVDLEKIDIAMSNASWLKKTNEANIKAQEKRLQELTDQEAGFPDLKAAEEYVFWLEGLKNKKEKVSYTVQSLISLNSQYQEVLSKLTQIRIPVNFPIRYQSLIEKTEDYNRKVYTVDLLTELLETLVELDVRRAHHSRVASKAKQVGALNNKLTQFNTLKARILAIKMVVKKHEDLSDQLAIIGTRITENKEKLRAGLGDECPLCGSIIKGE